MTNLIPRAPKRKKQPTAECMRQQLALAADEIIRLKSTIDTVKFLKGWDRPPSAPKPWWRRIFPRKPA